MMRRPQSGKKRPKQNLDEPALVWRSSPAGAAVREDFAPPLASARGRDRLAEWLTAIGRKGAAGEKLKSLLKDHPAADDLLGAVAEASPYLWDLVRADPRRTLRLLTANPDEAFAALLAEARRSPAAAPRQEDVMRGLRRMKAEAALLIALADIGGAWPVARVTQALTEVAETALGAAVRYLLGDAAKRGKLTPGDPQYPETGSGFIVLAMGKMGGHELNFSSDIDLMVFFDPAAAGLAPEVEPAPFYVRLTRELVKLLQERTPDGYVFRIDLRLRPDPSATQIAISTDAALDYYESRGQNWERAALIKARPCAGDLAAGEKLIGDLSPFVWRKYLDYATVADVHAMKQQIHAYRGHGEIAVEGHNVKLGRGGIREIEFFVQTQQLIAGGRHRELRGRSTVATLAVLAAGGWIDAAARDELTAAYTFLRRVEHRLQMQADEQTHTLPSDPAGARRIRALSRLSSAGTNLPKLCFPTWRGGAALCQAVRTRACGPRRAAESSFSTPEGESETLDRLAEMGFRQPRAVAAAAHRWHTARYPLAAGGAGAGKSRRAGAGSASTSSLACKIPTRHLPPSTASSPGCAPAGASSRCCGKIRTSSVSSP